MGSGCSTSKREELDKHDYLVGSTNEFNFEKNPDFVKKIQITEAFSVIVWQFGVDVFIAVSSKCTHYGADLTKGVVRDGKIYCPWHAACFSLRTGDIEEFPGLDGLPRYECKVVKEKIKEPSSKEEREIGRIYVRVEPDRIQSKVMRPLALLKNHEKIFMVIGSGPAGYMCAQTLRQDGYDGRLILITNDKYLPYDRPKLSKSPGVEWDSIKLRGKSFFEDNDIEILTNTGVGGIDLPTRTIYIQEQDETLTYDKLCICTGMSPRPPDDKTPGHHFKNIVRLHNLEQSQVIAKQAAGKNVVIVGSSFIAMELASALKDKSTKIDIIARSSAPFQAVLGNKIGSRILKLLLDASPNVIYHAPEAIQSFDGDSNNVLSGVTLRSGKQIPCELAIIAIGGYAHIASFISNDDPDMRLTIDESSGTITVDEFMKTSVVDIFAAGDCCNFPIGIGFRDVANIGHWQVALTAGRVAALNMLGRETSIKDIIPFFWTSICGKNLRYCGYGESFNEILLFGSLEDLEFCAVFRRDKRILAACGMNVDPLITDISVELRTESEWHSSVEFPACLTKHFPNPPVLCLTDDEIAAIAARQE